MRESLSARSIEQQLSLYIYRNPIGGPSIYDRLYGGADRNRPYERDYGRSPYEHSYEPSYHERPMEAPHAIP